MNEIHWSSNHEWSLLIENIILGKKILN